MKRVGKNLKKLGKLEKTWKKARFFRQGQITCHRNLLGKALAQTEEIIKLLADQFRDSFPDVSHFLEKLRYVDDLGKSTKNIDESRELIKETEHVLDTLSIEIKGWAVAGEDPPTELTEDGFSVGFAGMTWQTKIDAFKLNIQRLHFGKKKQEKARKISRRP